METKDIDRLVEAIQTQSQAIEKMASMHTKAPAAQGTFTELHGNGSLFGDTPVERDVITAHVRPVSGLSSVLPLLPSVTEDPRFATLTGYTATNGAEAATPCADAPAGYVKACKLTAQFGRLQRDTQTIEWDKVMLRKNRGDFTDLMLRGRVLGMTNLSPITAESDDILNIVTLSEMVIAAVNMERVLSRQLWQGSVANNNAGGGYKEMPGLDSQIATGQIDADNPNITCPALDSDVKNFNYDLVGGTGRDIVEYLSMLEFYLRTNAERMGLDPVTWGIFMRPELWFELSAVWPCRYNTHRCNTNLGSNVQNVVLGSENVAARDAMRNSMVIDINGNSYPVYLDTGIFEHTNVTTPGVPAGQYASSIYFVPLTITGGFPVTYREYLNYQDSWANANTSLLRGKENFWTDNGVYSWALEEQKWCLKLSVKTEQRVVLRTPHLAGRIDAVRYQPLQHIREPYPDSPYFFDGGYSVVGNTVSNAVWK